MRASLNGLILRDGVVNKGPHQERIHTSGAQGLQLGDLLTSEASEATGKTLLRPERPVYAIQCAGRLIYQQLRS